jgi:hypothetical protein
MSRFDRREALSAYTTLSPRWPEHENERLFCCWMCDAKRPWFHFSTLAEARDCDFDVVLEYFAMGHFLACNNCVRARCVKNPVEVE